LKEYPFKHPQVKFTTKIYHPNVNRTDGTVCEEMLSHNWSPQTQMREVLEKVYKMMEEPNPDNPVDEEITQQFKENHKKFVESAKVMIFFFFFFVELKLISGCSPFAGVDQEVCDWKEVNEEGLFRFHFCARPRCKKLHKCHWELVLGRATPWADCTVPLGSGSAIKVYSQVTL